MSAWFSQDAPQGLTKLLPKSSGFISGIHLVKSHVCIGGVKLGRCLDKCSVCPIHVDQSDLLATDKSHRLLLSTGTRAALKVG